MKNSYSFTKEECNKIASFARDSLDTYLLEDQKMDVGSVDDLLNKKGGILVLAESTQGMNRVRGNACVTEGQRIADSIIDAVVKCSSPRSIGSRIGKSERDKIIFDMAVIEEIIVTDDIINDIKLGIDTYYIPGDDDSWIYPTKPTEYDWTKEQFLSRTCRKSGYNPNYWKNNTGIILRTRPFSEIEPNGNIEFNKILQKI